MHRCAKLTCGAASNDLSANWSLALFVKCQEIVIMDWLCDHITYLVWSTLLNMFTNYHKSKGKKKKVYIVYKPLQIDKKAKMTHAIFIPTLFVFPCPVFRLCVTSWDGHCTSRISLCISQYVHKHLANEDKLWVQRTKPRVTPRFSDSISQSVDLIWIFLQQSVTCSVLLILIL